MSNSRNLFQHLQVEIVDPDTGKVYRLFLSGLSSIPLEVYNRLKEKKVKDVFFGPQKISPPMPLEEAAAYTEFEEMMAAVAEEMENLNS